jgi:hypothetical protein
VKYEKEKEWRDKYKRRMGFRKGLRRENIFNR